MKFLKALIITFVISIFFTFNLCTKAYDSIAVAKYNEGIDLCANNQYKEAILAFNKALAVDPTFNDAYYNLGSVYEYLKDYDNALATFQLLLARNPKDTEASLKIANLYYKKGNYQKALTYAKLVPAEDPLYSESQSTYKKITSAINLQKQKAIAKAQASAKAPINIYKDFKGPTGIAKDALGNLYVANFVSNSITKITPDGKRTTIAQNSPINGPIGIVADELSNIYVSNYNSGQIVKISKTGEITVLVKNIPKAYYLFYSKKILYVSEQQTNTVRKINL